MDPDLGTKIIPADYPQLKRLAWNRDPWAAIEAEDAFKLYERNWRFIERDGLNVSELRLIQQLETIFGAGFKLG